LCGHGGPHGRRIDSLHKDAFILANYYDASFKLLSGMPEVSNCTAFR